MDSKAKYIRVFLGLFLLSVLFSCEKFEGDQTIPAYIHVDTVLLKTNPLIEEGQLTHNFTDVWVYVNDQIIGSWELPATIPVLQSGEHKLSIYPGIWNNGISGTRGPYLFIDPWTIDEFDFVADSVVDVSPLVNYFDNTTFAWLEEFEDEGFTLKRTSNSDTTLNLFHYDPVHPIFKNSSGIGVVTADNPVFEVVSYDDQLTGFDLPSAGEPVFLEVDYNTNTLLMVGLFYRSSGTITQHGVLVLKPTNDQWNKVYVNFTPTLNNNPLAEDFNVFFRMDYDSSIGTGVCHIDNLKLVHREF